MKSGLAQNAAPPRSRAFQSYWVLAAVGLLYISFGVSFGLLEYGVPPILLSRGVDVAAMGWVIALYIPFGLTFLWAPLIDGKPLPWLSYRIGWIVLSQCIVSALMSVVAFGANLPAAWLFGLGLVICFAVATMDLALDALAVEIVGPGYRASAAALKVGALALGGLIGGGVLVGMFDQLQWQGTFLIAAAIPLVSMLPVLGLRHLDHRKFTGAARASIGSTLRRPGALRQLMLLSLMVTVVIALFYFQRAILVGMGVPLSQIGWTMGTMGPIINASVALLVVPLINRLTPGRLLWTLVGICIAGCAGLLLGISAGSAPQVIICALIIAGACSGLSVFSYTLMLRWAEGAQAATDYSVLCGGSRMAATLVLIGVPSVLPLIGWHVFYLICCAILVTAAICVYPHVQRIRNNRVEVL